ncbi:MAG: hypothetical protein ABI647_17335 [Gemmatimonadota bacterium]
MTQQRAGEIAAKAATEHRLDLRDTISDQLLRHLASVGGDAAREKAELLGKFKRPPSNSSNLTFLTAARAMLTEAQGETDVLGRHGMADALLGDLDSAVTKLEEATSAARASRLDHVGARADLAAVASEISSIVRVLDGLNRYRFAKDKELLAAWDSAKNVGGSNRAKGGAVPPKGGTESAK